MSDTPTEENSKQNKGAVRFQKCRRIARILAVQFLFQLDNRDEWSPDWENLEHFQSLAKTAPLEENDGENEDITPFLSDAWPYAEKAIRGIVECREELDALIQQAASNWTLSRMAEADRAILRLGTFEITKSEGVSAKIAINEAVELAKLFGQPDSARFVNGVLDKVRRLSEEKKDQK